MPRTNRMLPPEGTSVANVYDAEKLWKPEHVRFRGAYVTTKAHVLSVASTLPLQLLLDTANRLQSPCR